MATKNLSAVLRKVDDLCLVGIHFIFCCILNFRYLGALCSNVFFIRRKNAPSRNLARAVGGSVVS